MWVLTHASYLVKNNIFKLFEISLTHFFFFKCIKRKMFLIGTILFLSKISNDGLYWGLISIRYLLSIVQRTQMCQWYFNVITKGLTCSRNPFTVYLIKQKYKTECPKYVNLIPTNEEIYKSELLNDIDNKYFYEE